MRFRLRLLHTPMHVPPCLAMDRISKWNNVTQTQDEVKKLYRYVTDTKFRAQLKDMGGLRHAADKWNLFHNGTVTTVTALYF